MALKARLKFKGDISWSMEQRLMTKFGFRVAQRAGREFLIVEKQKPAFVAEVLVNGELPEDIQNNLIARCNTICGNFKEPEQHYGVIRMRLNNIALTLPPLQRKFVQEWSDRNCVEDQ